MKIFKWFDNLEDSTRHHLSRWPVLYAFVGGVGIVLFWRGIWDLADQIDFLTPIVSIIISTIIMLLTGTFVSFFIGGRLLLSGLMREKRIDEKTESEIAEEEKELEKVRDTLKEIKSDIAEMKQLLKK